MNKSIRFAAAVVLAVALSSSFSSRAQAAVAGISSCQVKDVIYDGRLFIDCVNATTRFVVYPSITCNGSTITQSLDNIKIWQSLAMAGLLAGKTLQITYENSCAAAPTPTASPVYNLGLNNQ